MSTDQGLAGYQSLFHRLSQAALCAAKDCVAEVHPTGQASVPSQGGDAPGRSDCRALD